MFLQTTLVQKRVNDRNFLGLPFDEFRPGIQWVFDMLLMDWDCPGDIQQDRFNGMEERQLITWESEIHMMKSGHGHTVHITGPMQW